MIARIRMEHTLMDGEMFRDHIILCGWNRKAEIILREYQAVHHDERVPIVVIAEFTEEPVLEDVRLRARVRFLHDDYTKPSALKKAGVLTARTCILISDFSKGRTEQDADARTILASLTVEKLNPSIYTCAEINNREYGSHLELGHVNDYVVSGEYSAFLLAHAALNRGLMGVFNELLTYERGNQFYRLPVPKTWENGDYLELFAAVKKRCNAIIVAIHPQPDQTLVNPTHYQFVGTEEITVIADKVPTLEDC